MGKLLLRTGNRQLPGLKLCSAAARFKPLLPPTTTMHQEKRYLHKSGHGTRLKALLHCKAQLLYTGIGYVAPVLLVAILCSLTSCREKVPER